MIESLPRTHIRNSDFSTLGPVPYSVISHLGKENMGKEEKINANIDCALDSCQAQCQEPYLYCFYLFFMNNLAYIVLGSWDQINAMTSPRSLN